MKRTPLQRKTPLRKTPIRPKVRREKDPSPEWWAEVKTLTYDRSGGTCEGQVTASCRRVDGNLNHQGLQRHHRKLRSQGGSHAVVNIVALCPSCHEWVHRHPEEARARGLICPRGHDPARWALTLPSGRVVLLTSEGGYEAVMDPPEIEEESA